MARATRDDPRLPGIGSEKIPGAVARVRRGVDAQLTAQRRMGQIETVDAGLIAIARTLADAVDAEHTSGDGKRYTVAMLAGRLVPVLLELRGERYDHGPGTADDELAALVAALRDTPRPNA